MKDIMYPQTTGFQNLVNYSTMSQTSRAGQKQETCFPGICDDYASRPGLLTDASRCGISLSRSKSNSGPSGNSPRTRSSCLSWQKPVAKTWGLVCHTQLLYQVGPGSRNILETSEVRTVGPGSTKFDLVHTGGTRQS